MFSTQEQLINRTPKNGTGRREYLEQLSQEFYKTTSIEAKEQVLANLANFSYDPINYEFIRELKIIDLFMENLQHNNNNIVHFSLAAICNLCLDPENSAYIICAGGIKTISELLSNHNEEVVLNAITTLMFLIAEDNRSLICSPANIGWILYYKTCDSKRLENLATIFLEDHCTKDDISIAEKYTLPANISEIPLPFQDT